MVFVQLKTGTVRREARRSESREDLLGRGMMAGSTGDGWWYW